MADEYIAHLVANAALKINDALETTDDEHEIRMKFAEMLKEIENAMEWIEILHLRSGPGYGVDPAVNKILAAREVLEGSTACLRLWKNKYRQCFEKGKITKNMLYQLWYRILGGRHYNDQQLHFRYFCQRMTKYFGCQPWITVSK